MRILCLIKKRTPTLWVWVFSLPAHQIMYGCWRGKLCMNHILKLKDQSHCPSLLHSCGKSKELWKLGRRSVGVMAVAVVFEKRGLGSSSWWDIVYFFLVKQVCLIMPCFFPFRSLNKYKKIVMEIWQNFKQQNSKCLHVTVDFTCLSLGTS